MRMKRLLALLAGVAFISLGLPDGLLGVAWPSMRAFFRLELDALGVLLAAATCGYVASSFSSGRVLRHVNLGAVLAASCALTALGLLGYAATSCWRDVIALSVVLGLGAGAIDAAVNTYAATNHGHRTLNWLHACFGVGAATGPIIMTTVLIRGLPWQVGYSVVGLAQIALAVCFAATITWWPRAGGIGPSSKAETAMMGATLRVRDARLRIAAFFVYSGVEGGIGVWTYTLLTEGRGIDPTAAGTAVSLFWGSLTGGRLLAAFAGQRLRVTRMLNLALAGVVAGTVLVRLNVNPPLTYAALALAGCACGPIFPTLVATTPARLGEAHAANAVGFQIAAAALGLALLPGAIGVVAEAFGVESIATVVLALAIVLVVLCVRAERPSPGAFAVDTRQGRP
jgi:fucose permease